MKNLIIVLSVLFLAGMCDKCPECPQHDPTVCDSTIWYDSTRWHDEINWIDSVKWEFKDSIIINWFDSIKWTDKIHWVDSVKWNIKDSTVIHHKDSITFINCPPITPPVEPPVTPPVDTSVVYVWYEDFESWPIGYLTGEDVVNKWQCNWMSWFNDYDSQISNVGGTNNKVWRTDYPAGRVGGDQYADGFGFKIALGKNYKELWLQQDIYVGWGFDAYNNSARDGGGKILPGFAGGPDVHVPYSVLPAKADPYKTGWMVHGMFVPLNNGATTILDLYMYWNNMYDIWDTDWGYAVYGTGPYLYNIWSPGSVHTYTVRVVMNTMGQKNGFVEAFWDGKFIARQTDMEFITNTEGVTKWIDGIYEGMWFGGGTPSDAANWFWYDNIIAYYYTPGHPDYRSGISSKGITPLKVSGYKYADKMLKDDTFTATSGTINAFKGSWVAPTMIPGTKITKTISVASATSVNITFPYWKIQTNYGSGNQAGAWVKVYNSAKTLLYTFNATNKPSTTYTIPGSKVYLEYYSGWNSIDGGWTVNYTSK